MLTSSIETYLNIVMQHFSDLLIEAAAWPDAAQSDVYSFWTEFDRMIMLLAMPQVSVCEIRRCLHQLWCRLESLDRFVFDGDLAWHIDTLRKALICVSPLIDEQLCRCFELPIVTTTKKVRLHADASDYAQER